MSTMEKAVCLLVVRLECLSYFSNMYALGSLYLVVGFLMGCL